MGYRKIPNLYKTQTVLMFKEVHVMEKIHGTSAHVSLKRSGEEDSYKYEVGFFSGGASHDLFVSLFDKEKLLEKFKEMGCASIIFYGEAYGGKLQGMKDTYGDSLKFIVFEAKISDHWVDTERADWMAKQFDLEFVWYTKCAAEVEVLNKYRDQPSVQAERNGCGSDKKAEGIVIRPTMEFTTNNGGRILAKHKRDDFSETKTKRKVVDPAMLKILEDAKAIAEEWVTPMRLTHVLDKLKAEGVELNDTRTTPLVIEAMKDDIQIEGEGEIVWTNKAGQAIAKKTAMFFKQRLKESLND